MYLQASRAQILKCATDYIMNMKGVSSTHKKAIDELRSENKSLEEESMYSYMRADNYYFNLSGFCNLWHC